MARVFDFILLDTAAGMGVPFAAAGAISEMALLVVTPDPVSLRDGRIVCDALLEADPDKTVRLVINKVPRSLQGCGVRDLDECIDTVGAQLIGVVPQSGAVAAAGAGGTALSATEQASRAFSAMAVRLCGGRAPLVVR